MAAPAAAFRKYASGRRSPVERGAARLVLGQEGRQFGRREVDFGRFGAVSDRRPTVLLPRNCGSAASSLDSAGIGHAGRQPGRSGVTRRPVETDASGAFRGIESGFERRGESRASCRRHGLAPSGRRGSRRRSARPCAFFDPTPVVGGGRPPVFGERDREALPERTPIPGSARSSTASWPLRAAAMHQAKSRCLASRGSAESASNPSAGGSRSQSVSSACRCASRRRSAEVSARSFSELRSGVSTAVRSSGRDR